MKIMHFVQRDAAGDVVREFFVGEVSEAAGRALVAEWYGPILGAERLLLLEEIEVAPVGRYVILPGFGAFSSESQPTWPQESARCSRQATCS